MSRGRQIPCSQLSIEAKFPLRSDPVTNRRPIVITANDQFIADPGPTKGNNRLVTAVASLGMDTVNRITLIDPHLYRGSGGPDACGDIFTADYQSEGRHTDDGPPVALHLPGQRRAFAILNNNRETAVRTGGLHFTGENRRDTCQQAAGPKSLHKFLHSSGIVIG